MKRPPKVKSAAATARNVAGAGSGTPDFYRISAIAPLPPASPFQPVAQESKADDNTPKYSIETLSLDDAGEALEMPIIGWSAPQSSETPSLPFSDPFEEDSPTSGRARSRKAEGMDHSGTSRHEAQRGQRGSVSAQTGTTDPSPSLETSSKDATNSNAETVNEAQVQKLSKADLNYLAHQNQILMLHVEKDSEGAKARVDKP
jgi:hypothetical protein